MALGGVYETGTLTIAVDRVSVTGVGTLWLPIVEIGDWLFIGGQVGLIGAIVDDTHLTLEAQWQGTLPAAAVYVIIKMSWLRYDPALTQSKLRKLLADLEAQGNFVFVEGDEPDPAMGVDGQWALKTNSMPWQLWYKEDGVWIEQPPLTAAMPEGTAGYHYVAQGVGTPSAFEGFLQAGAGAAMRGWRAKARDVVSVKDFGAVGDGTTNDTAAIQNAINAVIVNGGGTVYFPPANPHYKTVEQITIDLRGIIAGDHITNRLKSNIQLVGAGPGRSAIVNATLGDALVRFYGENPGLESHFQIRDLRISGNATPGGGAAYLTGSVGFKATIAAYLTMRNVIIEVLEVGAIFTDVEQSSFYDCHFEYNKQGINFLPATTVTSANSHTFLDSHVGGNTNSGVTMYDGNALSWFGGTIQYNGVQDGGAGNFGFAMIGNGSAGGYGTALFSGMIFEGNRGVAQFASIQSDAAALASFTFDSVSFERVTAGYPTNDILISGTGSTRYKLNGCTFRSGVGYTPSASRMCIANSNTAASISMDASTIFQNNVEAYTAHVLRLGAVSQAPGYLQLMGTGEIDFSDAGNKTLKFDGTNFVMNGTALFVNNSINTAITATTGVLGFGNSGLTYLQYDGSKFHLEGGPLLAGSAIVGTSGVPIVSETFSVTNATAAQLVLATKGVDRGILILITAATGYAALFTQGTAGNTVGNISVTTTGANYATTSDLRLKEDLKTFDAGNIIDNTNVYDFAWKSTGERAYGIIAQEAVEVYPAAIVHDQDIDRWFVDYSKYVPIIVQELKSLRGRVAALEGEKVPA